jgi:geranylgeranyl reductase family protein
MRRPDFDVIVVGAGAGGAAAAYYLTRAGLSVLVVEKARLPRYKACGGAIPWHTLGQFPFDFTNVIETTPLDVCFTFPDLAAVEVALPDRPVVMVRRSKFDAFLLAQSGAEVLDGTAVKAIVERDKLVQAEVGERKLTARYLVGADGATSGVARSLGLRPRRRLGGTLEAQVPLNGSGALRERYGQRAIFAMGAIAWGYAWVFPRGDTLSVGIGRLRPGKVDLHSALRRGMERLGIGLDGVKLHGHPLPCYRAPPWPFWRRRPQERLTTRRCVLVGDAAGLVDPLLGEGIRYALKSAQLAAGAIARDDLSGYEVDIWREIGHSLATAGLAAQIYYRLPWLGYQLGLRNPATIDHLVDVLAERTSYQGIGRRLIAATVLWPWRGLGIKDESGP